MAGNVAVGIPRSGLRARHAMIFNFEHGSLPGSLELAYLGDSLYDLYVREHLIAKGGRVRAMHREAISLVCAHAQSEALERVAEALTDAERDVVRRARNAHQSPPKNADPGEYHHATALEALIGWLYVTGQRDRMNELLQMALPGIREQGQRNREQG